MSNTPTHEFNVGDKVYIIDNNNIKHCRVVGIHITIESGDEVSVQYDLALHSRRYSRDSERVFPTSQDLIDFLIDNMEYERS